MTNEVQFRIAEEGSAEKAEVVALVEQLRAATADYITSHPDPRLAMGFLMSALPVYAGSLFATLMFMGEVRQQDQARMAKSVAINFRSGVKAGLARAKRVAVSENFFSGTPQ